MEYFLGGFETFLMDFECSWCTGTIRGSDMVFHFAENFVHFSFCGKVLLRDPLDDNVIPIVEELQRRLPQVNAICEGQVEDDVESGEQGNPLLKRAKVNFVPRPLFSMIWTNCYS